MRHLYLLLLITLSFAGNAQQSRNISLLCNWNDTANVLINRLGQRYNDVWGFTWAGKEYAAVGSTEGVHIIDIDQCKEVAFHAGNDVGWEIIHRDYKTYKNYLYAVCDEGMSALQIFDLSYLPDSLHLVYESNPAEFMLAHNIFIDTARGTLYACSPKSIFTGAQDMRVFSLADPEQPVFITSYNPGHPVHDVYVRNDTAFCSSSGYGYEVVDFTTPGTWQKIGEMRFYPYQGYNHSSWINDKGIGVMADETHGSPMKVIDTRNLLNIKVLSTFSPRPPDSTCVPHNPYLLGDFAFIAYYMDGFQVYDISDPYEPKRTGYYDTYQQPDYQGFAGAWGCYPYLPSGKVLISDMQTGLYVFDVSKAIDRDDTSNNTSGFAVWPNPFSDYVNVHFSDEDTGDVEVRIVDMTGRLLGAYKTDVHSSTIQPIQLTLPGYWAPGTYILSIRTSKGQLHIRKVTKR